MPELPEIEHLRRSLAPALIGAHVFRAHLRRRDMLHHSLHHPGESRYRSSQLLAQQRITSLDRRGKQLAIIADSGRALIIQLGMSGQLRLLHANQPCTPNTHIHAELHLFSPQKQGKTHHPPTRHRLIYRDPRRFGRLTALPDHAALTHHWSSLGPDALCVTQTQLTQALATNRPVKAALLDQSRLAGVGNIYADEALHHARIHPASACNSLSKNDLRRLTHALRTILANAITQGGSTLRDYVDPTGRPGTYRTAHTVYGRAGQPCNHCTRPLQHTTIAQRTTTYCAHCQPATRSV